MKVTARAHAISVILYTLPFLALIVFSLCYMWAGDAETILAVAALIPAVLYFFGARRCRYVVGVVSVVCFLLISLIPFLRGSEGRYFWVIWTPFWVVFAISAFVSFIPERRGKPGVSDDPPPAQPAV